MGGSVLLAALFCGLQCFLGSTVLWVVLFCGWRCFVGGNVLWAHYFVGVTVFQLSIIVDLQCVDLQFTIFWIKW